MSDVIVVREWDADSFHRRVLELEAKGYVARRETYRITPEMSPETGEIVHLHAIEMLRPVIGTDTSHTEKTSRSYSTCCRLSAMRTPFTNTML